MADIFSVNHYKWARTGRVGPDMDSAHSSANPTKRRIPPGVEATKEFDSRPRSIPAYKQNGRTYTYRGDRNPGAAALLASIPEHLR